MALQKQNVTIPVNSSIDTKRDPFLTDAEAFLTQENVRFYKTGAVVKRNGFTALGSVTGATRLVSDNQQLFALGSAGPNVCQSYLNGWSKLATNFDYRSVNAAQIKSLEFFGGEESSNGSYNDFFNGYHAVAADKLITAGGGSGSPPDIYVFDGTTYRAASPDLSIPTITGDNIIVSKCAWLSDGVDQRLLVASILNNGASFSLSVVILNRELTSQVFSNTYALAASAGDSFGIVTNTARTAAYIGVRTNTSSISLYQFGFNGFTSVNVITTANPIDVVWDLAINGTELCFLAQISTGEYPLLTRTNLTGTITASVVGDNTSMSLGTIRSVKNAAIWADDTGYCFAYSIQVQTTYEYIAGIFTLNGTTIGQRGRDYNVFTTGRGQSTSSRTVIPARNIPFNSTTGNKTFEFATIGVMWVEHTGAGIYYVSAALYDRSLDGLLRTTVTNFVNTSGSKYVFTAIEAAAIATNPISGGASETGRAILLEVDFANSDAQYGNAVNLADTLVHMDGQPSFLDGSRQIPINFHMRPYITTTVTNSGGSLAAGTFIVAVAQQIIDTQGNRVDGPLSNQVSTTTSGGSSQITIKIPVSKWMRDGIMRIYCTRLNDSILRLENTIVVDGTTPYLSYTITFQPSADAPPAYTTGGVLEHSPPPPSSQACIFQDRIFCVPQDDFDKIYYSNKYIQGEIPSFSQNLFIQAASTSPRFRDKVVACQGMGDKLYIFRENSIYWISGDGANLLGEQATFTEPEILSQDIGCIEPKSVILTPVGIMFKSKKGIYIITGGLSVEYIGAAVEASNSLVITDSVLISDRNIVQFITFSKILTYDYLAQRWSDDTIAGVSSVALWKNKIVALKAIVNEIGYESSVFSDTFGVIPFNIQMRVVTGWLKMSGIQDFARAYRLLILGRYESAHSLTVKVYYDYDESKVETFNITPSAMTAYQFKLHLRQQKCQSLKIEIFDTGTGESAEWTGLTIEAGLKNGSAKIATTRQY